LATKKKEKGTSLLENGLIVNEKVDYKKTTNFTNVVELRHIRKICIKLHTKWRIKLGGYQCVIKRGLWVSTCKTRDYMAREQRH
jgi:hypothetical protein